MRVHKLGFAAGGGFPQWNCNCRNCARLRQSAVRFTAVPLRSETPSYSPHRYAPHRGDTIGVRAEDINSRKNLFHPPGLGHLEPHLRHYLEEAGLLLVDGTVWTDDEPARQGISERRAREMGHLPLSGKGGMLSVLEGLTRPRKILIHINNTNPILDEESPERRLLNQKGIEVAYDGMEMERGVLDAGRVRGSAARQGALLSHAPPFPLPGERGQAQARGDPVLGREPLLLSGEHTRQGRRGARQLPGPVGLARRELWSLSRVLPGVRYYVNFARRASWQEVACSSR